MAGLWTAVHFSLNVQLPAVNRILFIYLHVTDLFPAFLCIVFIKQLTAAVCTLAVCLTMTTCQRYFSFHLKIHQGKLSC